MSSIQKLKKIINKYFLRILLFIIFYHGLIRPLQISINENIVKPLIENNLNKENKYDLRLDKNHTKIFFKEDKNHVLHFSIPFGQLYFFLLFFLWFKPSNLIKAVSFYNLALIPIYALAVFFFCHGYAIFGGIIIINEKVYRLTYGIILFLSINRPNQFNLIFNNLKNKNTLLL